MSDGALKPVATPLPAGTLRIGPREDGESMRVKLTRALGRTHLPQGLWEDMSADGWIDWVLQAPSPAARGQAWLMLVEHAARLIEIYRL